MAFSRRHYRAVSPPADTPADLAWRLKHHAALAQVRDEVADKYPTLTMQNIDEALTFQAQRIAELMEER